MLPSYQRRRYVNQRNFVLAVSGLVLLAIVGFFAYRFKFLAAPGLEVLAPPKDIATADTAIDVRGRSDDPEADLTVNGRPLYSGETGEFVERLYLVRGVNRLEFEAKNRYGRTTTIVRYVVAE